MLATSNACLIGFNSHTRGGNAWHWTLSQLTVPRKVKNHVGNLNPLFCYTTIISHTILNFIMIFPDKWNHYSSLKEQFFSKNENHHRKWQLDTIQYNENINWPSGGEKQWTYLSSHAFVLSTFTTKLFPQSPFLSDCLSTHTFKHMLKILGDDTTSKFHQVFFNLLEKCCKKGGALSLFRRSIVYNVAFIWLSLFQDIYGLFFACT